MIRNSLTKRGRRGGGAVAAVQRINSEKEKKIDMKQKSTASKIREKVEQNQLTVAMPSARSLAHSLVRLNCYKIKGLTVWFSA